MRFFVEICLMFFCLWVFFKLLPQKSLSKHQQCLIRIAKREAEIKCQDRYLARLLDSDEPTP